ncbi:acetyl-CoA synthetase-like protein [Periconia macrospinosa]|uniref:Acetyl-CoA synthetase-like protein n=1 Tax=Periconia macrospinosa TaxID=97972 RepID=A0A2V1DYF2_9PLEO|nr:acetyl-CoA synthetase-like protein [Periconia macrospinosa]
MAHWTKRESCWRDELLPHIIDNLATFGPNAPFAMYPNSPLTYSDGYRTVTYKELANAVNGLAWWLDANLGPSTTFEVLAYVGPNDVRYFAFMLAAVKAGYVAFLTSPRNSAATQSALFEQLNCKTLLKSSPTPPPAELILKACPVKHLHIPSVEDLLQKEYPHYSYKKYFPAASSEPFVILHTSGSTGTPKPVIWTHDTIAIGCNLASLKPLSGVTTLSQLLKGRRILITFPPYHAACIGIIVEFCIPSGAVSIAPLSGPPPTAEGLQEALKQAPSHVVYVPPSIIADLAKNSLILEDCAQQLEFIAYAFGDLPEALGNAVASKIPIRCSYGASEIGMVEHIFSPELSATDWRYVRFHPDLGFDFEETDPGLYELVVKRNKKYERNQLPFSIQTLKDLEVYRPKDLFEKHPTLPDYWSWRARRDDIIVFLNGLKTNPTSMEEEITASNKDISGAMVIGAQRFQAALLVEATTELEKLELIESIWPSVERANQKAPAYARIDKNMILVSSPDKPLIRSGKGAIERTGTLSQYSSEIGELYGKVDTELSGVGKASVDSNNPDAVSAFIQQAISDINPELLQTKTSNLFASGMDSLVSLRLVRILRHGLGDSDLNVADIHNYPSVNLLVQHITGSSETKKSGMELEQLKETYNEAIRSMRSVTSSAIDENFPRPPGAVVLLTGSTGFLGTQILEELLAKPEISHIYCLDRKKGAKEIFRANSEGRGSDLDLHGSRISFLQGSLDQSSLGLSQSDYNSLQSRVTLIIHCAWLVNFIMPLDSFKPHLNGLVNLFHMMANAPHHPPKLLHIPSISSVCQFSAWGHRNFRKKVTHDAGASFDFGYAQSKLFSEIMCDAAAQTLHIPIAVVRVGQIAGSANLAPNSDLWKTSEWLRSLVITSFSMGALPDDLGAELNNTSWVPSDLLATALVELAIDETRVSDAVVGARVFNLLNPSTIRCGAIAPMIASSVQKHAKKNVELIPQGEWLAKLREIRDNFSAGANDLARDYPAIKLLGFYEFSLGRTGEPITWDMECTKSASSLVREIPAISAEWVDKWVEGWLIDRV